METAKNIITSQSVAETRALGARLAAQAAPGETYALIGELGCGKTEFVRGFVAALNPSAIVRSPSFSLVNTYNASSFKVHHFDFYRLNEADELIEIGYEEYIGGNAVCMIEWADMFPEVLPANARHMTFTAEKEDVRRIEMNFGLDMS